MNQRLLSAFAGLAATASSLLAPTSGSASTFVAWAVTDIAKGDLLNVRAYPSSRSRLQVGYPNGVTLSMTGRCTGGVDLHAIQHIPAWKQRVMIRTEWCQVWHDPAGSGEGKVGWVY